MYVRHVSSTLDFSLSSHRLIHKFCLFLSFSRFIKIYNKQLHCRRRPVPPLGPSLVFTPRRSAYETHEGFSYLPVVSAFLTPYSFSVNFFLSFDLRPFLFCCK